MKRQQKSVGTSVWSMVIFLLCVIMPTLFYARSVVARNKSPEVVELEEITVIAPQPGVEITPEKTIIRMDEFKKPGTVRTLTDVLTEIGGIDVMRTNPLMASPGDEVSIRGLNEGRMVIEIDGRRINHTGHYGRYIVDWSTLNIDDIERIEIIRGGHSVLHPFAIGGVINIITKKGKKTRELKPDISISTGYGAYDTYHVSTSFNGGIANGIGYHFSASKQETDGYLRNNYQDTYNINGHLTFFLPHDATLSFGVKYSDVNYGLPVINDPNRTDYDPDYPIFTPDADQLRHLPPTYQLPQNNPHWVKHTTYLDGIFQMPLGPGTIKLHGFWTEGRRWLSMWFRGNFVENQFTDDRTKGVILEYRDAKFNLFTPHRLTFGLEYQELGWPDKNPIIYLVKSVYVQDVISLGERLTFTPGIRYYHVDMDTYYAWFEQGKTSPDWPTAGKKQDDEGVYPSFKLDFQATPKTALYAAISRAYRLPCP